MSGFEPELLEPQPGTLLMSYTHPWIHYTHPSIEQQQIWTMDKLEKLVIVKKLKIWKHSPKNVDMGPYSVYLVGGVSTTPSMTTWATWIPWHTEFFFFNQRRQTSRTKNLGFENKICHVSSVVDPDPYWIRIQELCGSGSVFPILSGSTHVIIG